MLTDPALADLRTLFADRLSTAAAVRAEHGQSESLVTAGLPDAVVFPRSTDDVAALARWSTSHRVPLVGWGAGTSLEGHALALSGGISVDFRDMAAVLEVRPEDRLVRVQPGITREALNTELRATGLMFPVDPGANASIGGMAATRASGTTAVRYGTMRDNVRGLMVVLADGRVIHTGTGAPKTAAGYDLTALFVGSEGTLGRWRGCRLRDGRDADGPDPGPDRATGRRHGRGLQRLFSAIPARHPAASGRIPWPCGRLGRRRPPLP